MDRISGFFYVWHPAGYQRNNPAARLKVPINNLKINLVSGRISGIQLLTIAGYPANLISGPFLLQISYFGNSSLSIIIKKIYNSAHRTSSPALETIFSLYSCFHLLGSRVGRTMGHHIRDIIRHRVQLKDRTVAVLSTEYFLPNGFFFLRECLVRIANVYSYILYSTINRT